MNKNEQILLFSQNNNYLCLGNKTNRMMTIVLLNNLIIDLLSNRNDKK